MPQSDKNTPFFPPFIDQEVITLTKNGVWLSDQTEIDHEQTVRLFGKSLKKDAEGYFLQIGRDTKRIQVEDTAYFVVGLEGSITEGFQLILSDETREKLDPATLTYRPGRLSCRIHNGAEEAKFLHKAYFEILKELQEDDAYYFLETDSKRIDLAKK